MGGKIRGFVGSGRLDPGPIWRYVNGIRRYCRTVAWHAATGAAGPKEVDRRYCRNAARSRSTTAREFGSAMAEVFSRIVKVRETVSIVTPR